MPTPARGYPSPPPKMQPKMQPLPRRKLPTGPAEPRREHPMVCGATFPGVGGDSDHKHICHELAQRPDQTVGVPQHRCATCGCTWITVAREASECPE